MSEVDKTIFELCNWIQKKLQLGDVKEVPKMVGSGGAFVRQNPPLITSKVFVKIGNKSIEKLCNFFCCFFWIIMLFDQIILHGDFGKRLCVLISVSKCRDIFHYGLSPFFHTRACQCPVIKG